MLKKVKNWEENYDDKGQGRKLKLRVKLLKKTTQS